MSGDEAMDVEFKFIGVGDLGKSDDENKNHRYQGNERGLDFMKSKQYSMVGRSGGGSICRYLYIIGRCDLGENCK